MNIKILACAALVYFTGATGTVSAGNETSFGWAACSSVDEYDNFNVTGGDGGRITILKSNGGDMKDLVKNAILQNDIVVLDGSAGDFIFSRVIEINGVCNKTIVGINNACIRTGFSVTQEIKDYLDALGINSLSSTPGQGLGGTLPNGQTVDEQLEYNLRLSLIEKFGDESEPYRYAGGISMKNASNVIIRNIGFTGPGSLDVGGYDLLTFIGCRNSWVDHCSFTDGLDGNFDIRSSDMVTVSWCRFEYTDKSYNHPLSNLTAGDSETDSGKLNLTWAYCHWADGCGGRMPFVAIGIQHIYNCYYTTEVNYGITGGSNAKVLAENNYFGPNVSKMVRTSGLAAVTCRGNIAESGNTANNTGAEVRVGYTYEMIPASEVPDMVGNRETGAGANLANPLPGIEFEPHPQLDFSDAVRSCPVRVSWPFDKGTENPYQGIIDNDCVSATAFYNLGANMVVHSTKQIKGCATAMTLLQPLVEIPKSGNADSYLRFSISQSENMVFVPETISFNSSRIGTDKGFFDIIVRLDGYEYSIAANEKPLRDGTSPQGYSRYEFPFPGEYASRETEVTIQLYDFSANKQWAFNDIEIKGTAYFFNSGIADILADKDDTPVYYNMQGMQVQNPEAGHLYIIRRGEEGGKIFVGR